MTRLILLSALVLAGCGPAGAAQQAVILNPGDTLTVTAPASGFNPLDYLAAKVCPDGSSPNNCTNPVPMTVDTPLTWRRGDFGNPGDPNGIAQILDAVLSASGQSVILDWSFERYPAWAGGGPTTFTPSRGDGGEIYQIGPDGFVRTLSTQAGNSPLQYFCGGTGWIAFGPNPPSGRWISTVAQLNISGDTTSCPSPLNPGFTRWRRETLRIANTIPGGNGLTFDCIIGEHYNGASIATAKDMEQSVWCSDWGRVAWASYRPGSPEPPQATLPWPAPPERPDFALGDNRLSTNVIRTPGAAPQRAFGWPPDGVAP